jgi:hypothetical protein
MAAGAPGDTAALAPAITNAIRPVDKDQPIMRVAAMDGQLAAPGAKRRFDLILFEAFAMVAPVLAATGIYRGLRGRALKRTHEIEVRPALGAPYSARLDKGRVRRNQS